MDFGRVQFGRRANKRFNYRPIYYDPDAEDLKHRVNRAKRESSGKYQFAGYQERIRNGYKNRIGQYSNEYNIVSSGAKVRAIFIVIGLGVLCYLTFYTQTFSTIFEAFYNA